MKSNLFKFLSVFFTLTLFILTSCEKPSAPDEQSAEDDARGSYIMADVFAMGNNEAGGGGKTVLENCYTVDRTHQDTVILSFDNCENRSGRIIVAFETPNPDSPKAVNTVMTFENYFVDNIAVEGTITSTFGGTINIPEINVIASNMVATFTNDKTISWSSNKTFKIVEGFGDGNISTNVLEISGTAEGINRKSEDYTSTYNAVTVKRACTTKYPISGTVTIVSNDGTTEIDYGSGECDNIITVTSNGISINVTLD